MKYVNGKAFQNLNKLTKVNLRWNICIDEEFIHEENDVLMRKVGEKCGFEEVIRKVTVQTKAMTVVVATEEVTTDAQDTTADATVLEAVATEPEVSTELITVDNEELQILNPSTEQSEATTAAIEDESTAENLEQCFAVCRQKF